MAAFRKTLSIITPKPRTFPKSVEVVISEQSTVSNQRMLLLSRDDAQRLHAALGAYLATGEDQWSEPDE